MPKLDPSKSYTPLSNQAVNLSGMTFGRLVVVRFAGRTSYKARLWECECECGEKGIIARGSQLTAGLKRSCGCLVGDTNRKTKTKHGMRYSPEYSSWMSMKRRCYRKKDQAYDRYGGRGITVCERWLKSFSHFFEDMGPRPTMQHTLDRIDKDGNYSLCNCRWATKKEQTINRRNTLMIEHNGKRLSVSEWSEIIGVSPDAIAQRLKKSMPIEKVLYSGALPISGRPKKLRPTEN